MFVIFILSPDVFLDYFLIDSCCADKVPSCPEGFLGDRLFLGEFVVQSDSTFSLEKAYDTGHTVSGWNTEYHVNVVRFGSAFDHLDLLLFGKITDDLSCALPYLIVEHFLSVFWDDDHVVGTVPSHVSLSGYDVHTEKVGKEVEKIPLWSFPSV